MRIRAKIVLVVLPVVVSVIVLVGAVGFLSASSAINRLARDFLGFKLTELEKFANSEWALVLETTAGGGIPGLGVEELSAAAQSSVEIYAASIVGSQTEIIFAVNSNGEIVMASDGNPPDPSDAEQQALSAFYAERPPGLIEFSLAGEARTGSGFFFDPFDWYFLVSKTDAAFYSDVNAITVRTAAVLGGAVLIITLVLLFFSGRLTRPLGRMVESMKAVISSGELSSRVDVEYNDETGRLAHTFNIMLAGLDRANQAIKQEAMDAVMAQREERRLRTLFERYVPGDVIEEVVNQPDNALVGKVAVVSVLFSHVNGFDEVTAQLPPDIMVESLNRYFAMVGEPIFGRSGIIDKYIGDAIMAVFGAPKAYDRFQLDSLHAALEMNEELPRFNAFQRKKGLPEFHHGLGLHYGAVTIGNMGTDDKMDYTVIGDTVNLASRLQGLSRQYRQPIVISESLQRKIDGLLPWRALDTVAVKGRADPVRVYTVAEELDAERRELWELHNQAMTAYYNRHFTQAIRMLNQALRIQPEDYAATVIRDRAETFRIQPPPADWSGVEVMTSK